MRTILLLLTLLSCVCCARKPGEASLGPGLRLSPVHVTTLAQGTAYVQSFEIARNNGQPFRFNGHVELTPEALVLVGLTPVGSRGFAATWNQQTFTYEHLPLYRLPLDPAELVLCWQLMFLPPEALEQQLASAHLRLQLLDEERKERHILHGNVLALRITYDDGGVHLENLLNGYHVKVQTRSLEHFPLDEG